MMEKRLDTVVLEDEHFMSVQSLDGRITLWESNPLYFSPPTPARLLVVCSLLGSDRVTEKIEGLTTVKNRYCY